MKAQFKVKKSKHWLFDYRVQLDGKDVCSITLTGNKKQGRALMKMINDAKFLKRI